MREGRKKKRSIEVEMALADQLKSRGVEQHVRARGGRRARDWNESNGEEGGREGEDRVWEKTKRKVEEGRGDGEGRKADGSW